MTTSAALLILLASLAIGITSAAVLSKRHRAEWRRTIEQHDSAYRAGVIELVGVPARVRVAIALSIAMACLCLFRVIASIDDILELTDEPHLRLQLVPRGPLATVVEAMLAFTSAAAGLRLYGAARSLANRRPTPHVRAAIALLLVSAVLAGAVIAAITRVPIVIYWQRRMLLYLVVHLAFAMITAAALAFAKPRT